MRSFLVGQRLVRDIDDLEQSSFRRKIEMWIQN